MLPNMINIDSNTYVYVGRTRMYDDKDSDEVESIRQSLVKRGFLL